MQFTVDAELLKKYLYTALSKNSILMKINSSIQAANLAPRVIIFSSVGIQAFTLCPWTREIHQISASFFSQTNITFCYKIRA
jgi:hypothetical protein